ncbi:MAG: tetratricopeptide repeat protein [Chlamydiae bacterium]|nr:tetratricopeptide repeat protein [Chlamydiota bacterium]
MFALAEIYRTFGDYKKSASYFSQLAERHSERKEELMFHTALCQAEYDRSLAIQTFSSIIEKDGAKANDAKLNRLILFFQEDRFQDVLSHYPDVASSLEQEKELSLDYIVGRSHFAEKNYEQAIAFLTRYTSFEESLSPQYRNSLLMLMNCAQKLDNEESFDMALTRFENLFPLDDELPQAIFIHAMMLKEAGNFLEAEQKLEQIITNYPNFEDTETLFLEYSLVTYNNQRFEKSHSTLNSFVHHYPKSHHSKIAWKYLLSCSLNLAKQVEGNGNTYYTKNNFLQDLTNVIKEEGVLSQEELKECLFLQAKVMYELGLYDVALNKLNEYLIEYKDDPSIPETHLLIALSHHKVGKNPELFCKHAENALKIDPDLKNKSSIHLELYNVYLSMIEKASIHSNRMQADQVELNSLYQLAAEHLYQAMSLKDLPVKLENKLWLANYYYDKLMKPTYLFEADPSTDSLENNELYQRSYNLFETILISSSEKLINLTNDQTHLEWEVLKFANLLGKEKKLKQKMLVLKDLAEQQQLNRSWDWKLQKETLLELAKTYEYLEDQENAYETYNFISTNYRSKPTFVSEFATLHANRLQFHLLSTNQKIEDNPQVVQILNNLKELQIRKHAQSEPIHLEASIEYSWIRANMISKDECEERYVFFLNRIQEDYSNQEDPIVVRYGDMLKKQNDKQELFDLYMRFVKAEILRTESLIEEKNGNRVSALSKQEEAEKLLNGCLASNYLTHYLYNRIQNSQKAIQAGKLY